MTRESDRSATRRDVGFRPVGSGHHSAWACGRCQSPRDSMVGRRHRRVRGVKVYVCAECVSKEPAK